MIGQTVEVLVTGKNPKREGEMIGRTETYRVVNIKSDIQTIIGEFIPVTIETVGPYSLRAKH